MSAISLDTQQIQTISSEIQSLDTTMINNYLPELESELNAIYANVQGEELHNIINTINSQFTGVKTTLSAELPKLETFLEEQIKSYTYTEEELDAELSVVIAKMDRFSGEALMNRAGEVAATVTGAMTGVVDKIAEAFPGKNETTSEMDAINQRIEALEQQNAELMTQNETLKQEIHENSTAGYWEGRGTDFANNFDFKDCNNVLDYAVEGITGSLRSIGDGAQTILDGLGPIGSGIGWGVSEIINGGTWLVDGLIGKGFKWNG